MIIKVKNINEISAESIKLQWDRVAKERDRQLRSKVDKSFEHVLMPTILDLLGDRSIDSLLDAGCGTGVLSEILSDKAKEVVGVDLSDESINIALASNNKSDNISYFADSLESFAVRHSGKFSAVVSNMVIQDCRDLEGFLNAACKMMNENAVLVLTFTHPWFWPVYWNYHNKSWFNYSKQFAIEAPFRISSEKEHSIGVTTHFHRPLNIYLKVLKSTGFIVEDILEPLPDARYADKFPKEWKFPRFIAIRCQKKID